MHSSYVVTDPKGQLSVRPPKEPKEPAPATLDLEALVEQLRKSPELANTLAVLLVSAPSEK